MLIIQGAFFGLVQALSEFLPISSSGHLIILHKLINSPLLDSLNFDTILHGGTLVAIIWFFWRDWLDIIKSVWNSIFQQQTTSASRLGWAVVIGTIPAGIAGFFLEKSAENTFRQPELVAIMLAVFALVLLWAEKVGRQNQGLEKISLGRGFVIGLSQALALVPGVSRAGITSTTGLFYGLSREAAVKFSFLLSAPIIAGAFLKQLLEVSLTTLPAGELGAMIAGFVTSGLLGYFVIKYLLKFISQHSFKIFVWYRIGLAILLLLFFR